MSQIAKINKLEVAEIDANIYSALKHSVYPGAKDDSIKMVLAYCKARSLDPLQKPVHIVPMFIKDAESGKGDMRDVVMPGIALYRIQAQRSGCYAGQSDPEFGEDVTETLSSVTVTYPKWCKVTVSKRMPTGEIVEYSAKEYWKENYATGGKDTTAPNAMWKKRPYAQLAKCAEAQALRKAFPDVIDQSPTAEEMEGKDHFDNVINEKNKKIDELNQKLGLTPKQEAPKPQTVINNDTGEVITDEDTLEQVSFMIETAQSINDLVQAADVARTLSEDDRKKVRELYKAKEKELTDNSK